MNHQLAVFFWGALVCNYIETSNCPSRTAKAWVWCVGLSLCHLPGAGFGYKVRSDAILSIC